MCQSHHCSNEFWFDHQHEFPNLRLVKHYNRQREFQLFHLRKMALLAQRVGDPRIHVSHLSVYHVLS